MPNLHDWTLISIEFEWQSQIATIHMRDNKSQIVKLISEGTSSLYVNQLNEWGRSVSINEFYIKELDFNNCNQLKIEMQSGDEIVIVADKFTFP